MRSKRFHGLKRLKIRQSWNKYNLYNLSRYTNPNTAARTFFQQKWTAKSTTRAYHGEQIREKQWQRMFRSTIRSVVPMNHRYLALHDGSEQAEGRGSGKEVALEQMLQEQKSNHGLMTPYMQMTFAPAERRLDTAVFRAMFASSARQARQFVIHGHVKVNGKKMIYPGYLLNPGDMYQVDTDSVMLAAGAPKDAPERRAARSYRRGSKKPVAVEAAEDATDDIESAEPESVTEAQPPPSPAVMRAAAVEGDEADVDEADAQETADARKKSQKQELQGLLAQAKAVLSSPTEAPSARRKQDLRRFRANVRRAIGRANRTAPADLDAEISALMAGLAVATPGGSSSSNPIAAADAANISTTTTAKPSRSAATSSPASPANAEIIDEVDAAAAATSTGAALAPADRRTLERALEQARDNPIDLSKPYATPWRPRDYLSAFAFVPRYLEVNHSICAAVYLRHPVARPGLAEVPTPFAYETGQLAFNWYLRRR